MWRKLFVGIVFMTLAAGPPGRVLADSSQSSNYKIDESFIGGGGRIDEASANFHAAESIGDVGVGNSASTNFQINTGYTTTNDPSLSFVINNNGAVNFGALSAGLTNTATGSFSVYNTTPRHPDNREPWD
jgi:hypothetical protein